MGRTPITAGSDESIRGQRGAGGQARRRSAHRGGERDADAHPQRDRRVHLHRGVPPRRQLPRRLRGPVPRAVPGALRRACGDGCVGRLRPPGRPRGLRFGARRGAARGPPRPRLPDDRRRRRDALGARSRPGPARGRQRLPRRLGARRDGGAGGAAGGRGHARADGARTRSCASPARRPTTSPAPTC